MRDFPSGFRASPRSLRRRGAVSLRLGIAAIALATLFGSLPTRAALHDYWPRFPMPSRVITLRSFQDRDEPFTAQTLAGLVARRARLEGTRELLWLPVDHPAYRLWYRQMLHTTGAREEGPVGLWELVARYRRAGWVKGYVLYHADESKRSLHQPGALDPSANVATSLCASLSAVAVSETEEAKAKAAGLARLFDARGMTEADCFNRFRDRFDRRIVALQDPKVANDRAEAVALGSFMMSRPGALYEQVLKWAEPDTPVLGWGVGDEQELTSPVSRWGHFITSTDWCQNLPVLSSVRVGARIPPPQVRFPARTSFWKLSWERDVHYASFVMSDGDNVQWLMGDFTEDRDRAWWSSPDRGAVPIGWTTCAADLAQLCPYTLQHFVKTATPRDDFLLFSGGYYYPDNFGAARPHDDVLRLHASRIAEYMRLGGLNLLAVNALKWESNAARAAYATYARSVPGLLGVFAVQYAPYAAGKGRVLWIPDSRAREVPVLSPRFALWAASHYEQDGSPGRVAEMLNRQPYRGQAASEEHFSWVVVHAWSWFRRRSPGEPASAEEIDQARGGQPGTARGLTPVKWCTQALEPHVRVVTPTELVLQMRLHLRPRQTLEQELSGLEERLRRAPEPARAALRERLKTAWELWRRGDWERCFAEGKAASALPR